MNNIIKKPELLIPAGSLEVLKVAVDFGADAVYIGGDNFSLRAMAKNFDAKDMAEGIAYAHERGVKVHVTANITAHNYDIDNIREYFKELNVLHPDAVIISDPGVFMMAKEILDADIERHISTQANNVNYMTFRFWYEQGAKRVVCGRELSLAEIKEIRENVPEDLEIECFIHGAMCISYSGRCLLSNFMTGRDANRGACTHPCRWKYFLMEESRPGEYFPVIENDRGTYIFNSKDLCMIGHVPELINAGIGSFKIEGRMKTALYVAAVTRTYRRAIDDYITDPALYEKNMDWYLEEIEKCTYRNYTTGFYFGKPTDEAQIYDANVYLRNYIYLGILEEVYEDGSFLITQRNKFCVGDEVCIMTKKGGDVIARVASLKNEEGEEVQSCPHPAQKITVKLESDYLPEAGDLLRMKDIKKEENR